MIIAAAGQGNVRQGHFNRFQHNKVFIKRDASGNAQKVIFGSMNLSVRGIYVQANNVVFVETPILARIGPAYKVFFKRKRSATIARLSRGGPPDGQSVSRHGQRKGETIKPRGARHCPNRPNPALFLSTGCGLMARASAS
jgi:phosphatidylserine/phosphatidylglycerophosphate/cardiolipin synthase-like enzyme